MSAMAGRHLLVTGGATGIGAAVARRFAAEGARVTLTAHAGQQERAEEVVRDIASAGGEAWSAELDVRDGERSRAVVESSAAQMGGLDAVVTCAGRFGDTGSERPLLEGDLEDWLQTLDVNLLGTWRTCAAAAATMAERGTAGTIVTLASVAAKKPSGAYSVSKAGVWMLTRALAEEVAGHGIRVNALAPGFVRTAMLDRRAAALGPGAGEAWLAHRAEGLPLRRLGTPEEVAAAALFLSGAASRYMTGTILHSDGGYVSLFGGG